MNGRFDLQGTNEILKTSTKQKQKDLKFGLSTGASPEYKTKQKQQTFEKIQRGSKTLFLFRCHWTVVSHG